MALGDLTQIGKGRVFFAAALIGLLFYLVSITTPVPNLSSQTDPQTNQTVQKLIYSQDSLVPPHNVTYGWAMLGAILVIFLSISDAQVRHKIDEREATEIALKAIKYKKEVLHDSRFGGEVIIGNVKPRKIHTKLGSTTVGWKVGFRVEGPEEGALTYFHAQLDPSGSVEAIMDRKTEFGMVDVCWRCGGKDTDILQRLPDEFKDLQWARRTIRGD